MKESKLKDFLYHAHCENKIPSSKRLYGGVGWVICQLCLIITCIISFVHGEEISDTLKDMWVFDLITSSALLGLSTITSAFGSKTINIGHPKKEEENEN